MENPVKLLGTMLSAATLVLFVMALAMTPGCKQGVGEVCQINDDCKSGLVCNPGTMRCQEPASSIDAGDIDARAPYDAAGPDASGDGDGDGDGD